MAQTVHIVISAVVEPDAALLEPIKLAEAIDRVAKSVRLVPKPGVTISMIEITSASSEM
jgi:hypothetical protein